MGNRARLVASGVIVAAIVGMGAFWLVDMRQDDGTEAESIFEGLDDSGVDLPVTGYLDGAPTAQDAVYDGPTETPTHGMVYWYLTDPWLSECQASFDAVYFGESGSNSGDLRLSIPEGTARIFVKVYTTLTRNPGPNVEAATYSGPVYGVMLEGGGVVDLLVPLCGRDELTYTVSYGQAPGWEGWDHSVWEGWNRTFGDLGRYTSVKGEFTFDRYTNWEIELNQQPGTRLKTEFIEYGQF